MQLKFTNSRKLKFWVELIKFIQKAYRRWKAWKGVEPNRKSPFYVIASFLWAHASARRDAQTIQDHWLARTAVTSAWRWAHVRWRIRLAWRQRSSCVASRCDVGGRLCVGRTWGRGRRRRAWSRCVCDCEWSGWTIGWTPCRKLDTRTAFRLKTEWNLLLKLPGNNMMFVLSGNIMLHNFNSLQSEYNSVHTMHV